jgi:thiol:disulfide interchange protein DsbD
MEGFKQLLGFSLIATTVWLVSVLMSQIGPDRTIGYLSFLTVVALACWVYGRWGGVAAAMGDQVKALAAASVIMVGGGWYFIDLNFLEVDGCDDGSLATDLNWADEIPWQPFSEQRIEALAGTPVFIDFTADWCLTCKVNEKTILETEAVKEAMQANGVVPLKADWTRPNQEISDWLHRYGRAGVPFYLMLPVDSEPIALPEVITQDMVLKALSKG